MKKIISTLMVLSVCSIMSGCAVWTWLITDNPDAPTTDPNDFPPPIVFKTPTNNISTNVANKAILSTN